jgi:hypothetical protein
MAIGMASVYTLVTCIAKDARGKDDWRNPFLGGGVAGAIAVGIKRRSIPASIGAFVAIGAISASPYWFNVMGPTVDEINARKMNRAALLGGPQSFAQASQSGSALQKRLL